MAEVSIWCNWERQRPRWVEHTHARVVAVRCRQLVQVASRPVATTFPPQVRSGFKPDPDDDDRTVMNSIDDTGEMRVEEWPDDDLEPVTTCPVCGDERRNALYTGLTDRVFGCAPGRWSLHRCIGCGSAFLDPRPTENTIGRAYNDYYTHSTAPGSTSEVRRLWRAVSAGYLNRAFHLEYQQAFAIGTVLVALVPRLRRRARRRARHLVLPTRGARLLDVGCGSGAFVAEARVAGWDAEGIDVDQSGVDAGQAAGRHVRLGRIDDGTVLDGLYDAITLSHVIEHVHDPASILIACAKKLQPGGVLWVATPDLDSLGHRWFGRDWVHLDPPRHLLLFTVGSLSSLITSAGFEELDVLAAPSDAEQSFAASHALRLGLRPFVGVPTPARVRIAAAVADMRIHATGRRSDEVIVTARKPLAS